MKVLLFILGFLATHVCFGRECYTNYEGLVKNSTCVFPFTAGRKTYKACTSEGDSDGKLWCSTKVDQNGKYIEDNWGYCDLEGCNTEPQQESIKAGLDCGNNAVIDVAHTAGPANDDELNPVGFWPWMASLGFIDEDQKWVHQCGATLITQEHFLTAAHCFAGQKSPQIRIGNSDITSNEYVKTFDILSWEIHYDYNKNRSYFDVAVIWVEPVKFSQDIRPICLPSQPSASVSKYDNRIAQLIGWGSSDAHGRTSNRLKRVPIEIFSQRECNRSHTDTDSKVMKTVEFVLPKLFQNHVICAGIRDGLGRGGSCKGDSGGPLMVANEEGKWTLVATVQGSVGSCGDPKLPGIFIRLDDPSIWNFINTSVSRTEEDGGTQLLWAAKNGYLKAVKYLLEKGANIEAEEPVIWDKGKTPLIYAAENGHLDVVKHLLEKGANIEAKDNDERTPLIYTAENGHLDVVKYLLEKGANIEAIDKYQRTPLIVAAENGHLEVVKHLLEKGANIEAKNIIKSTPLIYAAWNGQLEVVKYLLEKGANIEAKDKYQRTPLIPAAWNGHLDVVKYLLEKGANIEAKDNDERTPLIYAAVNGHLDVIKYLLEKSVNIEAKDFYGKTPLIYAAENGHLEIVKHLLEKGANIEAKGQFNKTPFIYAAGNGHLDVVKYLLEKGANIEAKDSDGWTPLIYAAKNGHMDAVKYLLEKGANIEAKNKDERTPLIYASRYGHLDVVKYLLEKGANIEAKDNDEWTPLIFAARWRNLEVVKYLLEKGANIEARDNDGKSVLALAWTNEIKAYLKSKGATE